MTTQTFMINVDDLLRVAEASKKELTVLTPATCYYRRQGDTDETSITYIDAHSFITALEGLSQT